MKRHTSLILSCFLFLSGCEVTAEPQKSIEAVGYASISLQPGQTLQQQTLQAIAASKLAAYRELAEQLYGQEINGEMTVSQMLVQNDNLRGSVHGLIRGAEVVATYPQGDTYITELKMDLDKVLLLAETIKEANAIDVPVIKVPQSF